MSRALVIKGANFYNNKVDTVTLSDIVPCDSISLSESSLVISKYADTETLTATVLPVDTTDNVIWSSSNTDVVTVDDGTITCVGVGTATITATCGTKSTTCAIDCSSLVFDFAGYNKLTGYKMNVPSSGTYASLTTQANSFVLSSETNIIGGYKAFYGTSDISNKYCLPIPKGATKVSCTTKVNGSATSGLWMRMLTFKTDTPASSSAGTGYESCLRLRSISAQSPWNGRELASELVPGSENADGFCFGFDGDGASAPSYEGIEYTVTFT